MVLSSHLYLSQLLGMLSGAILGNVFASPSVHSILLAIRVAAGSHGVLLIVKNYTGDRLNFGIATQRAKAEGLQVEMVLVDDDCALNKGKGITGRRGVAGTVLVHKVAGAAARRGCSLSEIKKLAQETIDSMATLGAALSLCSVPGSKSSRTLPDNSIEMAIGIHGEPGRVVRLADNVENLSRDLSAQLLDQIINSLPLTSPQTTDTEHQSSPSMESLCYGREVVVLINNLGGISQLELLVFTGDVLTSLRSRGVKVIRCYTGSLMTSLEMAGVSITVLCPPHCPLLLPFLDEPTTATAWIPSTLFGGGNDDISVALKKIPPPSPPPQVEITSLTNTPCPTNTVEFLTEICEQLIAQEPTLTLYDQICGDGDCGLTIKAGAQHVLHQLQHQCYSLSDSSTLCSQLATSISESMGGTSGILLELMLRAMALSMKDQQHLLSLSSSPSQRETVLFWSLALTHGVEAISLYGGAEEGMRTLLDSLIPATRRLHHLISKQDERTESLSLDELFKEVSDEAQGGMERTKSLRSVAGRSNYIAQEVLEGTPDPGAYAVALVFQTLHQLHKRASRSRSL
jgi:triose/dihydroxyacetone kinase / FAD-AMP lyase (cyclizing)